MLRPDPILVARRLEADGVDGCSEKYAPLALRFMAPVATVFAAWVLGRAKETGIRRLYFLSRDCQLILEAAKKLAPQFGNIECRYLQVSRQALFLPSTSEISEEGMPWLFEKKDCHELGPQLSKLELSVKEFGEGSENTVLETENEISAFWDALNRPPLREKLLTKIAARRDEARAYFEQQGLFEDVPWAIVDIGWMLRCQRALNDLLRSLGRRESIRGYYLGVQADREPEEKTGPIEALFINPVSGYGKKQSPILFKQVILIENLFCTADHPTVHHYENGPAYNREVNPATRKRFQSLEKAFSAFAEPCADIAPELAEPETAARLIDQLVDGFLNNPQADVICPLKDIEVSALQNDLDAFPAIRPLTVREALHPIFPSGKGAHVMWHRGSVEVSSAGIRRLYFFAYRVRSVRLRIFGK